MEGHLSVILRKQILVQIKPLNVGQAMASMVIQGFRAILGEDDYLGPMWGIRRMTPLYLISIWGIQNYEGMTSCTSEWKGRFSPSSIQGTVLGYLRHGCLRSVRGKKQCISMGIWGTVKIGINPRYPLSEVKRDDSILSLKLYPFNVALKAEYG